MPAVVFVFFYGLNERRPLARKILRLAAQQKRKRAQARKSRPWVIEILVRPDAHMIGI